MQILKINQDNLAEAVEKAVSVLQAGGLVVFPTETVYGAGVDATSPKAVAKLLEYKTRREGKPLSIAVTDLAMAEEYVELSESAKQLYQRFLPGPMTVVSKGLGKVAPGVESEYGTLGVRISSYPLVEMIVQKLGCPFTATSANGSGGRRPYSIPDLVETPSKKQQKLIGLMLDAGVLPPNPPSTVIDTTLSAPVIFRQGEIEVANSKQTTFISHSVDDTHTFAQRVLLKYWNDLKERGLVIALDGSLGVGKTEFVKGAATFLNIKETVKSPTYSYVEEYPFERHGVTGKLTHADVWKVSSIEEFERLRIEENLGPNQVVFIEWADLIQAKLQSWHQEKRVPIVSLTLTQNGEKRSITFDETLGA